MRRLGTTLLLWLAAAPALAAGTPLIADLSSTEIAITTGFSGARLLLFGAVEGAGDIAIVVRGPTRREVVRRKTRIAGVWVNRASVAFRDVPAYYRVASTRPLDRLAREDVLGRLKIGAERLALVADTASAGAQTAVFRAALLRKKRELALFGDGTGRVAVIGGRLFRTTFSFPANVPTGTYAVEVYLFRDGRVVSTFRKPLTVHKAGIEARIFNFAHQKSAVYGAIAIVMALMAGWVAGVVFRRV